MCKVFLARRPLYVIYIIKLFGFCYNMRFGVFHSAEEYPLVGAARRQLCILSIVEPEDIRLPADYDHDVILWREDTLKAEPGIQGADGCAEGAKGVER